MHDLQIRLGDQVHNLAHYGCDPHSVAFAERALLRAHAREEIGARRPLLAAALLLAAFATGFAAISLATAFGY